MAISPVKKPSSAAQPVANQNRELRREAPDFGRVRRCVARGAEEHGVPEGQQAAESDQQVEGAGEQREAHRLHRNTG